MDSKRRLFEELKGLSTEQCNPRTIGIDMASTEDILRLMNGEDRTVADAVQRALPEIARAVDLVVASLRGGGRLLYFGAGTSGRLGVLDAAECPPTFGVSPDRVVGVIAGGRDTVFLSREGVEDVVEAAEDDVADHNVSGMDTVIGITASRRTPYVKAALCAAREAGASTVFLTCNEKSNLDVDVEICVLVGPEAIAGSTRLKSGTAHKMVLNMISTASMVRLGKVYQNLMVDLKPNSDKLCERAKGIIARLAGLDYDAATDVYERSGRNVKVSLVMARLGLDKSQAEAKLAEADGFLARALGER